MYYLRLIIFISLLIAQTGLANEHGEAPAPAHGEAPAAAHGESAPAAAAAKTDEWLETSSRVAALKAKIKMRQDTIKKLVEEKAHEKNPDKISEIIKSMVEEYKNLKKEAEDFNQQSQVLKYRFPEKSIAGGKRKYERVEITSLEQMESQMTLDAKIKKTVAKAKQQFSTDLPKKQSGEDKSKESLEVVSPAPAKIQKPTNLTEPVIIEK